LLSFISHWSEIDIKMRFLIFDCLTRFGRTTFLKTKNTVDKIIWSILKNLTIPR
jgi:hypothetical protein